MTPTDRIKALRLSDKEIQDTHGFSDGSWATHDGNIADAQYDKLLRGLIKWLDEEPTDPFTARGVRSILRSVLENYDEPTTEDHYVGKTLSWPVRGREGEIQTRTITAYDGATKTITIESTTGPSG